MNSIKNNVLPSVIVFEGVDGTGKTTFTQRLAEHFHTLQGTPKVYLASFPGSVYGTLGEWVYRLHHGRIPEMDTAMLPAVSLQLLHVAAHIDILVNEIHPRITKGEIILLDRFWWSTYAYARLTLAAKHAMSLVEPEIPYWADIGPVTVIYLSRKASLKQAEISPETQQKLETAYEELLVSNSPGAFLVHRVQNDGSVSQTWNRILEALDLGPK
jgi:thymidylate kinase